MPLGTLPCGLPTQLAPVRYGVTCFQQQAIALSARARLAWYHVHKLAQTVHEAIAGGGGGQAKRREWDSQDRVKESQCLLAHSFLLPTGILSAFHHRCPPAHAQVSAEDGWITSWCHFLHFRSQSQVRNDAVHLLWHAENGGCDPRGVIRMGRSHFYVRPVNTAGGGVQLISFLLPSRWQIRR